MLISGNDPGHPEINLNRCSVSVTRYTETRAIASYPQNPPPEGAIFQNMIKRSVSINYVRSHDLLSRRLALRLCYLQRALCSDALPPLQQMLLEYFLRACCIRRVYWACWSPTIALPVLHDTDRKGPHHPELYQSLQENISHTIAQDHHRVMANRDSGESVSINISYRNIPLLTILVDPANFRQYFV